METARTRLRLAEGGGLSYPVNAPSDRTSRPVERAQVAGCVQPGDIGAPLGGLRKPTIAKTGPCATNSPFEAGPQSEPRVQLRVRVELVPSEPERHVRG